MEIRKNRKTDLERKRGIFFQFGLILTLLAVFTAFEYKTYEQTGIENKLRLFDNTPEEIVPGYHPQTETATTSTGHCHQTRS